MALLVVYRRQVGRDLAAALGHYEGQTERLGERFLAAVDSVFDAIERYPDMFALVHGEVRRARVSLSLWRLLSSRIEARGRPRGIACSA